MSSYLDPQHLLDALANEREIFFAHVEMSAWRGVQQELSRDCRWFAVRIADGRFDIGGMKLFATSRILNPMQRLTPESAVKLATTWLNLRHREEVKVCPAWSRERVKK